MKEKELLLMSQREINRLECLEKRASKQLTQCKAAELLGVSTRQVRRLERGYKRYGAEFLLSKHRGKLSNNRLPESTKDTAIKLIKQYYPDFGPTLAHEKLTELHGLELSLESLRCLMMEAAVWQGKKRKVAHAHQMRCRRSSVGELVQIDGSPHDWFEGRGERCCLLVFVDDATGRIMMLHFEEEESSQGYYDATYKHIMAHGIPMAFYSDRHGIFRVNIKEAQSGTGKTQFSRALEELDIKLINANSPQAKGRVENKNGTLQDRLVKELRLQNVSDIKSGNAFLPTFIRDYNRRFAKPPSSPIDLHRKRNMTPKVLRDILSHQHERIISKNLEVHYQNKIYQIQSKTPSYTMRKAKVVVHDDRGKISLIYKGKRLSYKVFDKGNQSTQIASSKQLNQILEKKRRDKLRVNTKPRKDHPWRTKRLTRNNHVAV